MSENIKKIELAYGIYKKEVLALTQVLHSFADMLRFAKDITCYTDAKGIVWLSSTKDSCYMTIRLAVSFSDRL